METTNTVRLKDQIVALGISALAIVTFACVYSAATDRQDLKVMRDQNAILTQQIAKLDRSFKRIRKYTKSADALANGEMRPSDMLQIKPSTPNVPDNPTDAVLGHLVLAAHSMRDAAGIQVNPDLDHFMRSMALLDSLSRETEIVVHRLSNLAVVLKYNKDVSRSIPSRMPVEGRISSEFGERLSPFDGMRRRHEGLDIATEVGSEVIAPADGTVTFAGDFPNLGRAIVISHGSSRMLTRYGHLSRLAVKVGDVVTRGALIAYTGNSGHSTGPHLHYEVWVNDQPVNPREFFFDLSEAGPLMVQTSTPAPGRASNNTGHIASTQEGTSDEL